MATQRRDNNFGNSGGRGNIGVQNYIGGFDGGGQSQVDVPVRDDGFLKIPSIGGGSSSGLDIYAQGSPPVARDLQTNPLTVNELEGIGMAKRGIGMLLPGPAAYAMNSAIDYNLGKDAGTNQNINSANTQSPDTMGGRMGYYSGQGNSAGDSAKAAFAGSGFGQFIGAQRPAGMAGAGRMDYFGAGTSGAGFQGVGDVGYNIDPLSGLLATNNAYGTGGNSNTEGMARVANQMTGDPLDNMVGLLGNGYESSGGFGSDSSGGYAGGTGDAGEGDEGNSSSGGYTGGYGGGESDGRSWADGGAVSLADGGQVGMTGQMYSGANAGPANLTQMGFADGGGIGMGGPGAPGPTGGTDPAQMQEQINQMVRNPQFKQVAQQAVGAAMQSGELTPDEVVTMGRIAEAAMHNPSLYPQLRQFAAQNGMTPLPPSYDPRLVMVLVAVSRMMGQGQQMQPGQGEATQPGQIPSMGDAQMHNPTGMANGGFLRGPGTGRSDSIGTVEESTGKPVKVANGEYVIPEHIVRAKGKDFFDKMLRQYADVTPKE